MRNSPRLPRSCSSAHRKAPSISNGSPRLPPSPRATSAAGLDGDTGAAVGVAEPSVFVVDVLGRFLDLSRLELRGIELVVRGRLDRLFLLDLDRLDDLRLALAARSLGDRRRLRLRGVLLIGSAFRTDRLGLAQVVELGTAIEALALDSHLQLRHRKLPGGEPRGAGQRALKLASDRRAVNRGGKQGFGPLSPVRGPLAGTQGAGEGEGRRRDGRAEKEAL